MTHKPRQIVIDKDAFLGIGLDSLREFAKSHFLLLSGTLLYECMTATRQVPQALLDRYEILMKAGAYYCSMSRRFVEWECRHCEPYPWFLADMDETDNVRTGRRWISGLLTPEITDRAHDRQCRVAEVMLLRQSKECMEKVGSDLAKEFKVFPTDVLSRFRKILDEMLFDIRDLAVTYYSCWIVDPVRFCPSHRWMTWHEIRLTKAVIVEYVYLRQIGGVPSERRAEHDYQDMEYVLLLSRADAIITRDKKLVGPLARAAFPEKDVFSSLEEMPDSYRCDWSEG